MSIRNALLYTLGAAVGIGAAFQLVSLTATLPEGQIQLTQAPQPNGSSYWVLSQIHSGKPVFKGKMLTNCQGQFVYLTKPTQPTDQTTRSGTPISIKDQIATFGSGTANADAHATRLYVIGAEKDNETSLIDPAEASDANIIAVDDSVPTAPIDIAPLCGTDNKQIEQAVLQVMTERLGVTSTLPARFHTMSLQEQALTPRGREIEALRRMGDSDDVAVVQMMPTDERGTYDFKLMDGTKLLSYTAAPQVTQEKIQETLAPRLSKLRSKAIAYLQEKDGEMTVTYVLSNGETIATFDNIRCPDDVGFGSVTKTGALGRWGRHIGNPDALPWCDKLNKSALNIRTAKAIGTRMMQQLSQNGKKLGIQP